jgi:hypothetical protein
LKTNKEQGWGFWRISVVTMIVRLVIVIRVAVTGRGTTNAEEVKVSYERRIGERSRVGSRDLIPPTGHMERILGTVDDESWPAIIRQNNFVLAEALVNKQLHPFLLIMICRKA